jgi:hypothetical protein
LADSPFSGLNLLANGLVYPVIFAIVTLVTVALFALVWRRLAFMRRLLPLRKWEVTVWPPGIRAEDVTVAYALIPPAKIKLPYYMVEEGDVRCLYLTCALLADLFGQDHVKAADESALRADIRAKVNLVILSGPVWNATMSDYLGRTGSPVSFMWDGDDLKLHDVDGQEFHTTYVGDHRVKQCHGLIVAAHLDVDGHAQRVVIVAGCSNVSTYAGAELLARLGRDRSLRQQVRDTGVAAEPRWALIYEVINWAENPDYDTIPTMQSGSLGLKVIQPYAAAQFREPFEFHLGPKAIEPVA